MATLKRYKATKQQRSKTRAASAGAYAKMVTAASAVVIENRGRQYRSGNPEYVLFEFPHWIEFGGGFPKGHIVGKTELSNTHKINAVKLLDWLYSKGHSMYDSGMLVQQTQQFERLERGIDKLFND